MTKEKIYPKGIITFAKNEKAPDFVKGTVVITPNDLMEWLKENQSLLTEYNGKKQLKLQLLEGKMGLYFVVDDWKPTKTTQSVDKDDFIF